jgi:NADPH:quinone reductase-like Zn-dependent oxidoreductase
VKAIVQDVYGSADVLELGDVDTPAPTDDEVLLRVHAAGVGPDVWHLMTGLPYLMRVMGYGLRRPKTRVRGWDVAGRVESVGKNVKGLRAGDEVYGTCNGSFAEYASARADRIAPKPANLDFEQAAAVPISGQTALQGLRDAARVKPGDSVLVIGAAGGVGTFAVQIANAFEAVVTGVCSTTKADLVRSMGADQVVDYTREDFAASGRRYDVILDTAGNRTVSHLRRALDPDGTLVIVGGEGGGRWFGGFDRQVLRAPIVSAFVSQKLVGLTSRETTEDLVALTEIIEAGKVTPIIEKTYPLSEAPEAIRHLAEGHAGGKLVLAV